MKKILIGAASLLFTSAAFAADLPVKAPPPAPVAVYNWTGFYIGGNVGYGWGHTNSTDFSSAGAIVGSSSSDSSGVFGGGQIGYNVQVNPNWLLGIEADGEVSDIKGTATGCSATGCASGVGTTDDFGTVRGRIGYIINNTVLLYGTGGWAWSHSHTDRTVTCVVAGGGICPGGPSPSPLTGMVATASGNNNNGWVAGAGVEWQFAPNWTAKIEYQHLEFNNEGRDFSYVGFPTAFRHIVSNSEIDTVRVGVNYLFNLGGPAVVARY